MSTTGKVDTARKEDLEIAFRHMARLIYGEWPKRYGLAELVDGFGSRSLSDHDYAALERLQPDFEQAISRTGGQRHTSHEV